MSSFAGQLATHQVIIDYMLAGNATVTLKSRKSGSHYTYNVRILKGSQGPWFVAVSTGDDFLFIGTIFKDGHFAHSRKSPLSADARSVQAFAWSWDRIVAGRPLGDLEVWHQGTCGKCGRALTHPDSIASGIGPICAAKR